MGKRRAIPDGSTQLKPPKRPRFSEWLSDAEESDGSELDAPIVERSPQWSGAHEDVDSGATDKTGTPSENEAEDEKDVLHGTRAAKETAVGGSTDLELPSRMPQFRSHSSASTSRISITSIVKSGSKKTLSKANGIREPSKYEVKTGDKQDNFLDLGVHPSLVASLAAMSIRTPTPVQAACIPPLIKGMDCIGNAKTGSGKTVAFAIPILQKLIQDPYGIFALVLTPTRELAFQIADQFTVLGGPFNARTAVIVGGMDMIAQAIELENRPHIVVATPGRLVDHLNSTSGSWNLSRVKHLVLDEADRLLTPTFASELAAIFKALPADRQTSLFTATITDKIEMIADAEPKPGKLKPFVHRMTDSVETVLTLKQYYLLVPSHVREVYLYYLLCNPPTSVVHLRRAPPEKVKSNRHNKAGKGVKRSASKNNLNSNSSHSTSADSDEIVQPPPTIIFCTRPKAAAYLTEFLKALSIRATPLHSRLTQRERLNSLGLFRAYVVPVLVSTDVGARGLDIDDVAMVINWDTPTEAEEYTHRVGRTARMGKGGIAVSFVTERDQPRVEKIEERIGTQLVEMELPESKVLESINKVFTAQRVARMQLQESDFGKREEIHQAKNAKRDRDRERHDIDPTEHI